MSSKIKIKVVGIGGSGSNAISRMTKSKFSGVDLIAISTDAQDLKKQKAQSKLIIGRKLTQGLGTGMNPELGERAAIEQKEEIRKLLEAADMVFIACGLGGGTGTGAAPVIAEIAKSRGALTIAVVTTPFFFEGAERMETAQKGLEKLRKKVDTLIAIPNDNLLKTLDSDISLTRAFWACDEILHQAIRGISDLIVLPGIVNVTFADIRSIIEGSGSAFFGMGRARGQERAKEAARLAIYSPLLDILIEQAKGILFNVSGPDVSLYEIDEAAKVITKNAAPEAKVIFGAVQNEKLKKGEMKVTVIATGF